MVSSHGFDHALVTGRDRRAATRVGGLNEAEKVMGRKAVELVREGKYVAEVTVELIEEEGGWSP